MATRKQRGDYDRKIAGLYDLEDTIGRGHFAVVKLARHVFTGEKVAVKVIDKTKLDEVSKNHLFQEVRCMKLVQHPNVVRLYEVIDTQTKLYLILELGVGGDMYDYIMKHDKGVGEELSRRYFKQIVSAISYCHQLHVCHRDLKPENVVFSEKMNIVKLTDFGFSNVFKPGKKLETSCGSLAYSAPEILLGDSYDAPAVDVWSLGVMLYMLVCGTPPFYEANDSETLTMIMDCRYEFPSHVSTECQSLISRMLIREPNQRAGLEEIMNHDWLQMGDVPDSATSLPLISKGLVSSEDHTYVVERMIEGRMATKEEISVSLDKDAYDHIAATYYLMIERRLKAKQAEATSSTSSNSAANAYHFRKNSASADGKPHLEPLALSPRSFGFNGIDSCYSIQIKDDDSSNLKHSIVQTLVSPPGPLPSTSSRTPASPARGSFSRKYSLIKEESVEEEGSCEEVEFKSVRSAENLMDSNKRASSVEHMFSLDTSAVRRPLHSVASSPQLLNQISEERESDEEEDIPLTMLPTSLTSSASSKVASRNIYGCRANMASPEVLHKYEQHKKRRGTGQRGTSCSSSDASDTDDTDSIARKDKLKHKFATRRDSSDHSSDNDGPGGIGGMSGGPRPLGQGGTTGSNRQNNKPNNSNQQDKSSDNKGNRGSSGKSSKGNDPNSESCNHDCDSNGDSNIGGGNQPQAVLANSNSGCSSRLSGISINSCEMKNSNSLVSSNNSFSKLCIEDNLCSEQQDCKRVKQGPPNDLDVNYLNELNAQIWEVKSRANNDSKETSKAPLPEDVLSICSADCSLHIRKGKRFGRRIKTDINRNGLKPGFCKMAGSSKSSSSVKVETKCCSLV